MLILPRNDSIKGHEWGRESEREREKARMRWQTETNKTRKEKKKRKRRHRIFRMDLSISLCPLMLVVEIQTVLLSDLIDQLAHAPFLFLYNSRKTKLQKRVPRVHAVTHQVYICRYVSVSRLCNRFAIYEARAVFAGLKFIVVSEVTNSPWKLERPWRLSLCSIYRTPKQPSWPARRQKEKLDISP